MIAWIDVGGTGPISEITLTKVKTNRCESFLLLDN